MPTKKTDEKTTEKTVKKATVKKATVKKNITFKKTPSQKGEVQAHGKFWENQIISIVVSPSKREEANVSHTARHDIDKALNKLSGKNVSIKATGTKGVDFGDANRVIENLEKDSPLEAIVIRYKQQGNTKQPTSVTRIDLTQKSELLLGNNFNSEMKERVKKLDTMLKTGDNSYKKFAETLQKDMKENGAFMSIRPKVGNKAKKRAGRLQISLTNIEDLINKHPEIVIENEGCNIYGIGDCLTSTVSGRRTFAKNIGKTTQKASKKLSPILEAADILTQSLDKTSVKNKTVKNKTVKNSL